MHNETEPREPAFLIMQRTVARVPELAGYHFWNNRAVFKLRTPTIIEGREVDEIAIRGVDEHAWMRVADIEWAVNTLREILDNAAQEFPHADT